MTDTYHKRRQYLINQMQDLIEQKLDCFSCTGVCCTSLHNSMKITSEEAIEIKNYLLKEKKWNLELKLKLEDTVKDFRLDKTLILKKGIEFRRTYTCPFYKGSSLGCDLPKEIKPLGCLAFNPVEKEVKNGGNCQVYPENEQLKISELDSAPIPIKLLTLF
jgi:hypothetical protein